MAEEVILRVLKQHMPKIRVKKPAVLIPLGLKSLPFQRFVSKKLCLSATYSIIGVIDEKGGEEEEDEEENRYRKEETDAKPFWIDQRSH